MPFVNIRTARGLLDDDQKARLLDGVTDLMVAVEGKGDPAFRPSPTAPPAPPTRWRMP